MNCDKCGTELGVHWDYSDHQEGAKFAGYKGCSNCGFTAKIKEFLNRAFNPFYRGSASMPSSEVTKI